MSGKSLCTLLVPLDKHCLSTAEEIQADLEGSDAGAKADALKRAIMLLLNGHMVPNLLATVVRQVLPSQERTIQRLLLLYLEVVADERDKVSGNFIPENEMIVISHHLRSNLHHPNEHIRAVTLRLLCRLREPELLQPLVPSILANLRKPHPLVRRHVFSAVSAIYRRRDGRRLIPDAPSVVERALAMEQDPTARRNAFLMLCDCDLSQVPATRYLLGNADRFAEWPAALQTAAVGFVRRVHGNLCHNRCICLLRRGYTEIIVSLLSTSTAAVIYDCACTLLRVSSEPTSIHTAAKAYCQLLTSQRSDNKVKLVILDRLHELCTSQLHYLMVDFVRNILRSLATPDLDVRSKALDLVLGLLTAQNVDDVVRYLKHEFFQTPSGLLRMADDYGRTMLVRAIHACAMEYPRVAISVVPILSNFLGCSDASLSYDIVLFLGEFIEAERFLRLSVLHGLIDKLCRIKESFICSCALWIIGEYSCSLLVIERAISTIKEALGDEPYFHVVSQESESGDSSKPTHHPAMDSSTICSKRRVIPSNSTHNLRVLILSGDFHLAAVVACTLTKLVLRLEEFQPSKVKVNEASAESLRIMVSMLQLGKSSHLPRPIDSDSYDRIVFCVRLLCRTDNNARKVWLLSSCQSFTKMLAEKQFRKNVKMKDESQNSHANPDDSIDFYHLKSRRGICQLELEDEVRDDLKAPTVQFMKDAGCANKLNRPVRLTGFSDPVYVEGSVTVNQYHDTVLDITVINRTKETMRNLRLEFATACKTTVVERSRNYTVAPRAVKNIQANIQLSSTNLGIIISRIVYETSDAMESSEVILKDMGINIAGYMTPATCTDVAFRNMWAECCCKVKLKVNTVLHDEKEFVNFIIKSTNMTCLTPMSALDGDCGLVAANLYAKSVFGEDALVNISIEKEANRKLSGSITIRGNVQGLVLNLAHAVIATQQATVVDAAMSLSEACHKYYR